MIPILVGSVFAVSLVLAAIIYSLGHQRGYTQAMTEARPRDGWGN